MNTKFKNVLNSQSRRQTVKNIISEKTLGAIGLYKTTMEAT